VAVVDVAAGVAVDPDNEDEELPAASATAATPPPSAAVQATLRAMCVREFPSGTSLGV
jgi:hypothetical protein